MAKSIKAEYIPVLYCNVKSVLDKLGATGTLVLTGSGAYVGIMRVIDEKDRSIHDLDLKLIPDNPITAIKVLTTLSVFTGKQTPTADYLTIKGEPVRYDFMFKDVPVNVWLMIDPVRYDIIKTKPSKICAPVQIPIEKLDDIFMAKAKMNRPKDVKDIEDVRWMNVDHQLSMGSDDILHPWIVDSERKLTPEEIRDTKEAVIVEGQFGGKSIRFTVKASDDNGGTYFGAWQYINIYEPFDGLDKLMIGDVVKLESIILVKYRRFKGSEEKLGVRVEL